jgi:hypothetical protein
MILNTSCGYTYHITTDVKRVPIDWPPPSNLKVDPNTVSLTSPATVILRSDTCRNSMKMPIAEKDRVICSWSHSSTRPDSVSDFLSKILYIYRMVPYSIDLIHFMIFQTCTISLHQTIIDISISTTFKWSTNGYLTRSSLVPQFTMNGIIILGCNHRLHRSILVLVRLV